jgi:hypothetical protein
MLYKNFLIIYCFISKAFCQFSDANQGLIYRNWHFKLYEPKTLKQDLKVCELNIGKELKDYILCLNKIILSIASIYTNSFKFEHQFQFGYLGHPITNKELQAVWLDLIYKYAKANQVGRNKLLKLKIFFNYFSLNNHIYRENQPVNDENPNLLMHADNGLKINESKCIYAHQIKSSNESFHFKYGNCDKKLAFICVKPIQPLESNQSSFKDSIVLSDRCSLFKTIYPGGNWLECDKINNVFKYPPVEFKLSETQKCCMFNFNMKENFENAKEFCSRFNSEVFSFKTKGYKRVLENYANFLNVNLEKSNLTDFSNFWTSCKMLKFDLNNPKCPEDDEKNNDEYLNDHSTSQSGLEIFSLTYEMSKEKFEVEKFSLTVLLDSFHKLLQDLEKNATIPSGYYGQLKHLEAKLNNLVGDMVILVKKKVENIVLETQVIRSRKLKEKLNETDCFTYKRTLNDTIVHISLPFLRNCYHLTLFRLATLNISIIEPLFFKSVYEPNKINEHFRTDLVIKDMNYKIVHGILNVLGIYDLSCELLESHFNSNTSQAIVLSKHYLDNTISKCKNNLTENSPLSITISNKISWKQFWPFDLKTYLDKSSFILMLHSYSLIVKILHFDCSTEASKIIDLIVRCMRFYNKKFCLFTCPINCEEGNVWQFKRFRYLLISNICQSALHSNLLAENSTKQKLRSVLFLELNDHDEEELKHKARNIRVSNNQVTTIIWPSNGFSRLDSSMYKSSFYFRPRFEQVNKKTSKPKMLTDELFLLMKSVHPIQTRSAELYLFGYRFEDLSLGIKRLIFLEDNEYQNFTYSLNQKRLSSFVLLNFSSSRSNCYFSFKIVTQNSLENTINFPINFENFPLDSHTIHLDYNNAKIELKGVKADSGKNCTWFVMNYNTKIKCSQDLNFTFNLDQIESTEDFSKQNLVVFMHSESSKFSFFSRIIFVNDSIESQCKNGGKLNEDNMCVCYPGFGGVFCENICELGHFGRNCNYTCPSSNCSEFLICLQDPIGCSCALGWKGYACNQTDTDLVLKVSSDALNCTNKNQIVEKRCVCTILFKKNYFNDQVCTEIFKTNHELDDLSRNKTDFPVSTSNTSFEKSICLVGKQELFENFYSIAILNTETNFFFICYFNVSTLFLCENASYSSYDLNFVYNYNQSETESYYLNLLCAWNFSFDLNRLIHIEKINIVPRTSYKLKLDVRTFEQLNVSVEQTCFFVFKKRSSNASMQILIGNHSSFFCLNNFIDESITFYSNFSSFYLYAIFEFCYNNKTLRFGSFNLKEIEYEQNDAFKLNESLNANDNRTLRDVKKGRVSTDIQVELWKMLLTVILILIFSFKLIKKWARFETQEEFDSKIEFDLMIPKVI